MLLHQDGSTHQWVPGCYWDLIVTMDDATNEHYSLFFVDEEGTASSFQGGKSKGLFCSLYTDCGSHYWNTPEAGGKVDKTNLTQFGRAMQQLGIEMIPAETGQFICSKTGQFYLLTTPKFLQYWLIKKGDPKVAQLPCVPSSGRNTPIPSR